MLRNWIKIVLFLSSYIPLFGIIMIRNYESWELLIILGSLIIGVLIILRLIFFRIKQYSGKYIQIDKIDNLNKAGLEYFITYIIPFLAIDIFNIKDIASILIIFFVMGVIYMKSDLIYMNPILNLAGFNLFKVTSKNYEYVIISRKKKHELLSSEEVIDLADQVYYGTSDRHQRDTDISK